SRENVFTHRTQKRNAGETGSPYVRDNMTAHTTLVVVGQGMVGYKLLECLVENGGTDTWRIIAFGEEPRAAYDRVSLSTYFTGRTAEDLSLVDPEVLGHPAIEFVPGDKVTEIDRAA